MLIYDLDFSSLTEILTTWKEPAYRAKQIWQGLYQHLYDSPDQFTNLSKPLRERMGQELTFSPFKVKTYLDSSDGHTRKTLFELEDGNLIEAVLMKYDNTFNVERSTLNAAPRHTLCISTQAGCAMGCVFCATGQMGFKRNLSSGEIVAQVMYYARMLRGDSTRRHKDAKPQSSLLKPSFESSSLRDFVVTNIVFMGMGEPFHNYENVMKAIDVLNDAEGFNFGARRFTISTVGLVPQIKRFADELRQVNLAISLHAADDQERLALMPINKKYNIAEVIEACKYYVEKTHRRVTFEWALIHGVNDTPEVAKKLAALLRGLLCHVNAIPLNPTAGFEGAGTSKERALLFKETLEAAGIPCTIRLRRGIDIQAGCGQLAGEKQS